jgi:dTMP kinase
MNIGKFIVLEGIDGCGKTTVMKKLEKEFPDFVYTREPGGSVFGEKLRKVILDPESVNVPATAFLLTFMAARSSHLEEFIWPALDKGKVVISDRFDASTFAFQLCGQQNLERQVFLEELFWYLREEIIRTDKGLDYRPTYIHLDISMEIAASRRIVRQGSMNKETHFDLRDTDFHYKVSRGYKKFFTKINKQASALISPSENPVHVVDASLNPDEVYSRVRKIILKQAMML